MLTSLRRRFREFAVARGKRLLSGKTNRFLVLGGVIFLVVTFFGGDFGFVRLAKLKKKKEELIYRTRQIQTEIISLDTEKDLLKNNPFYLEKIAREKFGLSHPEEKVYRFLPSLEDSSRALP